MEEATMKSRSRRGNRQAAMKARLGIATAVLVGGGAIGVAAVAATSHGTAPTTAESAGFTLNFHHTISEQQALSSALSTWGQSQQKSMTTLAEMAPMRTFSQFWSHHTEFAAQRGVVVLATKKFLLVKSADRQLHLWWLNGATKVRNVSASATGMAAMTGNAVAATAAMKTSNMTPAVVTMAGSTSVVSQMAAPVSKPTTITVDTGNQVITITITSTTATVTQPATTTATTTPVVTATATSTATATPTATAVPAVTATKQPTMMATAGVARGDLVFVVGVRSHGKLIAQLVLFAAPATAKPAPTVTSTSTVTPAPAASASPTHF
jgi:hypothetical protein